MLKRLLLLSDLDAARLNDSDRLRVHHEALQHKPMLLEVFREFHRLFRRLDQEYFGQTQGLRIELGAGVMPVRGSYPDVLATEVVKAPHLDRVLDAQAMDLGDATVRALYGQNCFHHFPDPELFLQEANRVLVPGGGIILIEPFFGPLAAFLYKRMFATERFDKTAPDWRANMSGPMTGANQALSYIVFVRDRARFNRLFPALEIVYTKPLPNYMRYLLSGGLNFRQLVPTVSVPLLKWMETAARPVASILALHHVLVIRRKADVS